MNKFYVYALVDPRDGQPFYIGKGSGRRVMAHVPNRNSDRNAEKGARIRQIIEAGLAVEEVIVYDGLTEGEAFRIERAAILETGLENLTNIAPGNMSEADRIVGRARRVLQNSIDNLRFVPSGHPELDDTWVGNVQAAYNFPFCIFAASLWEKWYFASLNIFRNPFDKKGKPISKAYALRSIFKSFFRKGLPLKDHLSGKTVAMVSDQELLFVPSDGKK